MVKNSIFVQFFRGLLCYIYHSLTFSEKNFVRIFFTCWENRTWVKSPTWNFVSLGLFHHWGWNYYFFKLQAFHASLFQGRRSRGAAGAMPPPPPPPPHFQQNCIVFYPLTHLLLKLQLWPPHFKSCSAALVFLCDIVDVAVFSIFFEQITWV